MLDEARGRDSEVQIVKGGTVEKQVLSSVGCSFKIFCL